METGVATKPKARTAMSVIRTVPVVKDLYVWDRRVLAPSSVHRKQLVPKDSVATRTVVVSLCVPMS